MKLRRVLIIRAIVLMVFATTAMVPITPWRAVPLMSQPTALAMPQTAQPCLEDFTSDTDPTSPGFASSVFNHSLSGNYRFTGGLSGFGLAMFAGATDAVTFPGQTVTRAQVSFLAFGPGYVIFEGAGDTLTVLFHPVPGWQTVAASDTTQGDNTLPLGQILKVTLIGYEANFDNLEIDPCGSSPSPNTVAVRVRPGAINPRRNDGVMKAVILSNAIFDATTVDPTTVHFGAATVSFSYFFGDEDGDGYTDLIFFFLVRDVGISCGDTSIHLTGQTTGGQPIEGEGSIRTVACP